MKINIRKTAILLLCLILLFLTGCSSKELIRYRYHYKGENDNWEVVYKEISIETYTKKPNGNWSYDCTSDVVLTAIYKKDLSNLEKINEMIFGYEAGFSKSSVGHKYNGVGPNTTEFVNTFNSGLVSREEDEIAVTITIDDQTETIRLEKQ